MYSLCQNGEGDQMKKERKGNVYGIRRFSLKRWLQLGQKRKLQARKVKPGKPKDVEA